MMDSARVIGFEEPPYFLLARIRFGRDLFTLIWLGLRTSLLLGFMASIVNIIVGIIWGAVSAYYGGQVDILRTFQDIWGSFLRHNDRYYFRSHWSRILHLYLHDI